MAIYIVCHSEDAEDVEIVHDVDLDGCEVTSCAACTEAGVITSDKCDRCGSAQWHYVTPDGRALNPCEWAD